MTKFLTVLLSFLCMSVLAFEVDETNLFEPEIELVMTIHEYCLEQHSEISDDQIEKELLSCVNTDLEITNYEIFKSYAELKTLLSQNIIGEQI